MKLGLHRGLDNLQVVTQSLCFANQQSRMSWRCHKAPRRTRRCSGGNLRRWSNHNLKEMVYNQLQVLQLLASPQVPLHTCAWQSRMRTNSQYNTTDKIIFSHLLAPSSFTAWKSHLNVDNHLSQIQSDVNHECCPSPAISWNFCFCSWQRWVGSLESQEIGVTGRKLWQSSQSLFE